MLTKSELERVLDRQRRLQVKIENSIIKHEIFWCVTIAIPLVLSKGHLDLSLGPTLVSFTHFCYVNLKKGEKDPLIDTLKL